MHARHDQERRSSCSGSSSSAPQWTNAVNMSSSESSVGFQRQQRYWLVLSRHSQPWKADREGQQRCDAGRSATQASFTPSTSPTKFLWEQIRLSMQACNSQPSSKAKKSETELLGRLFSVKVYRQQPIVQWKLVTIPFASRPFVLEPMHYQCLCKSSIDETLCACHCQTPNFSHQSKLAAGLDYFPC